MLSAPFSPCVVIPCYNHGAMMASVLARLAPFNLPVIVVDDGSDAATQLQLATLHAPQLSLLRLDSNQGKGAAVIHGLRPRRHAASPMQCSLTRTASIRRKICR